MKKDINKSVVRVMIEIIQDGGRDLILNNIDTFIELEKSQLELAYLNGELNTKKDFNDFYLRTFLKELHDLLNPSKENDATTDALSCNPNIRN